MGVKESIISNIVNFYKSAEMVYKSNFYTSAYILYFKSLVSLIDLEILQLKKVIPKDHTQRFEILTRVDYDSYKVLSKFFEHYRNAYSSEVEKNVCKEIRNEVKKRIKRQKIHI